MTSPFYVGQTVAFVGSDDAEHDLYAGQPGVVIDLGPLNDEPSVAFAFGPSVGIPVPQLTPVDAQVYESRIARMRCGHHPTAERRVVFANGANPAE